MGFKLRFYELLLEIKQDICALKCATQKGLKTMSESIDAMRVELANLNAATNESAVEVDRLATLLEQALNRTDATAEEEEAFLEELRSAVPGARELADRLRVMGKVDPQVDPEPVDPEPVDPEPVDPELTPE